MNAHTHLQLGIVRRAGTIVLAFALAVTVVVAVLATTAAPAFGWSNNGDGFGTHDWVLFEANRLAALRGHGWVDMKVALPVTDDPDHIYRDFDNHMYDIEGGTYGGAPRHVANLYAQADGQRKAGDMAAAGRTVGLLAHYYADLLNPLHTIRSGGDEKMHIAYEAEVGTRTDAPGENRSWVVDGGMRRVSDVERSTIRGSYFAHGYYSSLTSELSANGFDAQVEAVTKASLNRAVNDVADLIVGIDMDAGNAKSAGLRPGKPKLSKPPRRAAGGVRLKRLGLTSPLVQVAGGVTAVSLVLLLLTIFRRFSPR